MSIHLCKGYFLALAQWQQRLPERQQEGFPEPKQIEACQQKFGFGFQARCKIINENQAEKVPGSTFLRFQIVFQCERE